MVDPMTCIETVAPNCVTMTTQNEWFRRNIMVLCLGATFVLLGAHWRFGKSDHWQLNAAEPKPKRTEPKPAPPGKSVAATNDGTKLVVDLSDRRVYLYKQQTVIAKYNIAIGQDGWETPSGSFQVLEMQQKPVWIHPITGEAVPPGPDNPLGDRWIGFWIDGNTHIGFHGTNQEELIGMAVSHGCIRMRNQDIDKLYEQVKLGTPVTVQP